MTDEELRRAYQAAASLDPAGRAECPDGETIAALVEREGKEGERLALLDHVMTCSACRRDFELLRAVHVVRPAPTQRRFQPLAMAASIALLVGLGGVALWSRLGPPGEDMRRAPGREVELIQPANASVVRSPLVLVWHAVGGARSYTVELLANNGRLVRSWTSPDTSVAVPPSPVSPGSYGWWVRAHLSDGSERRSPVFRFQLR
jgi:hypothetical protein